MEAKLSGCCRPWDHCYCSMTLTSRASFKNHQLGEIQKLKGARPHHCSGEAMDISNEQVLDNKSQSPWRLSFITGFFCGIAEFVVLFFRTLLQQDMKKRWGYGSSSNSRYDERRGRPGNYPCPQKNGLNLSLSHLLGPNPPSMASGWGRCMSALTSRQLDMNFHGRRKPARNGLLTMLDKLDEHVHPNKDCSVSSHLNEVVLGIPSAGIWQDWHAVL